jgi:hypothetical protein
MHDAKIRADAKAVDLGEGASRSLGPVPGPEPYPRPRRHFAPPRPRRSSAARFPSSFPPLPLPCNSRSWRPVPGPMDPKPYRVIHTCASLHSYDLLMTNQRSAQLALRRVLAEDRKGRSSGMAELELTDSSQMLAEAWDHESRSEDNLNPGVALAVRAPRHPTRALFAHDLHVTSKV